MKRSTVAPHLLSVFLLLPGCTSSNLPDIFPQPFTPQIAAPAPSAALATIAEEVWKRTLEKDISLRIKFGLPIESLPEVTHDAAVKDAGFAASILGRLRALDPAPLNEEDRITYGMLQWQSQLEVDGLPYFWHTFPVTPYATRIRPANLAFASFVFQSAGDTARYLRLIDAYPGFIDSIAGVIRGQAERGIRLPKDEIAIVTTMIGGYRREADASRFLVAGSRLSAMPGRHRGIFRLIERNGSSRQIHPPLGPLLYVFHRAYSAAAPASVSLVPYPRS